MPRTFLRRIIVAARPRRTLFFAVPSRTGCIVFVAVTPVSQPHCIRRDPKQIPHSVRPGRIASGTHCGVVLDQPHGTRLGMSRVIRDIRRPQEQRDYYRQISSLSVDVYDKPSAAHRRRCQRLAYLLGGSGGPDTNIIGVSRGESNNRYVL